MSTEEERRFTGPLRGQIIFAVLFAVVALVLLSQIGEQTKWAKGTKFAAQPRFWPAVALGVMVLFGGLYLWKLPRRRLTRDDWREARKWLEPFEYAAWFLSYVLVAPVIGYLLSTLIFVPALAWRMGYRTRKMMAISLGFGLSVVVIFKSFLEVKIPGGLIYDWLPVGLRSFFHLNF